MSEFTLPWPPVSTNHAYSGLASGRLRKTKSAASWQAGVALIVAASGVRFPRGKLLALTVWQYPPPGWKGDVDGIVKLCMDAIFAGLGLNDYWVSELHVYRGAPGPEPRVVVTLEEVTDAIRR